MNEEGEEREMSELSDSAYLFPWSDTQADRLRKPGTVCDHT